jgi:DNA polymerase epsilon subunit 1
MDFCRDERLFPKNNVDRWVCDACFGEFDRHAIEFTLMDVVYGLERSFAQQDLRCSRCQQIQSDNVSRYCHCSGAYQFTLSKADVRRKLRTIVNVAIVHRLPRLKVRSFWVQFSVP